MTMVRERGAPAPVDVEVPADVLALWAETEPAVLKYPDPRLRKPAKPNGRPCRETRALAERMKAAMVRANGIGLSAPQIGVSERVIVYRLLDENSQVRTIVNPKIVSRKGEQIGLEGCLSLPMLHGDVKRAQEIVVKGVDLAGRPLRRRATDLEARVIQHEMDHLDGVLFIDRAEPGTLHWSLPGDENGEDEDPVP
ncbi:MAG TPA: peptide deformylase [Chthonomonadales bacterium]|nr:peptide deformylase [Chthonomonadales bacterium]